MPRMVWMLALFALIIAAPILTGGEFTGTDNQASALVAEAVPGHEPWFTPLMTPPPAVEGLLFTLQAVIGALVIGYIIGRLHGARRGRTDLGRPDTAQTDPAQTPAE